jgi:hypothetical protein
MELSHVLLEFVSVREPTSCWGCRRAFEKGTRLFRRRYRSGGKVLTDHWCPVCLDVVEELPPEAFGDDTTLTKGRLAQVEEGVIAKCFPVLLRLIGDAPDLEGMPQRLLH